MCRRATLPAPPPPRTAPRVHITTFFGLPAHPFFVQLPIILIPLCGIGAMAMAVSPTVRARYGMLIAGLTVVAGISTQFAISSGQGLRDSVPDSAALNQHIQIAESIRPLVLLLFLAIVAMLWLDRRAARVTAPSAVGNASNIDTRPQRDGRTVARRRSARGGGAGGRRGAGRQRAAPPDRAHRRQGDLEQGQDRLGRQRRPRPLTPRPVPALSGRRRARAGPWSSSTGP